MSRDRDGLWVVAALLAVQVFFGLHYLAAKLLLLEVPPRAWALVRAGGASVLLLGLARLSGRRFPTAPADLARLALYSLFGVVVNQVCFVEGLSRTTPVHSSLINTTIPVMTLLLAVLAGQERGAPRKWMALALALLGVLLIVLPERGQGSGSVVAGDLLTLVNATSYSLFLVLSRRMLTRVDPLAATALLLSFGTLGIAVVGLPELLALDPRQLSASAWGLGLFIVLFPTAGAYLLSYWALSRVDSSVVAFFIYLQPVIATALSMIWLGERPSIGAWTGAALIFAGVYLTLTRREARRS